MNIEKLIANVSLSPNERKILEYILANLDNAASLSVRGVAADNYTSTSTVMRVAKKLGYSGFVELVFSLKPKLTHDKNLKSALDVGGTSTAESTAINNLAHPYSALSELIGKNQILVYGQGFSEIIAEYIYKKLLVMGRKCWCIQTLEFETVLKNFDGKIGAVIIISKSGMTPYMVEIANKAKKSNTAVVAITGNQSSALAVISDIVIYVEDDCPFDDENACPNNFFGKAILAFEQVLREYSHNH